MNKFRFIKIGSLMFESNKLLKVEYKFKIIIESLDLSNLA